MAINKSSFTALSPKNLRLVLAHHPALATSFQAMAHVILFKCAVPERQREIAIIRTGALTRSEYEWGMHVSIFGEKCGLDAAQVDALSRCPSWQELSESMWTPAERLIVRMVDELHHHCTLSDATWGLMDAQWPREQIIELILAASFYHMAAFFLNSTAVPLEQGSQRFPAGMAQAAVPA
ncbi:carboxymuconolactone decarboxylase family protein [Xenophilus sp.]|uniref:carboxymuconolactone decarboxylase family protein n=1 Tax=Xenophilus sp. TaxID=1873499 RepID=UPI0037DD978C